MVFYPQTVGSIKFHELVFSGGGLTQVIPTVHTPRGFVEARLEVRPSMFPSHVDGGFHIVSQDDEL